MATDPKTIPLADLFPDGTPQRQRRTRQPRGPAAVPGITKEVFKDAFELASAGLSLAGAEAYALSKEEIERMADAWYRLAKEYPAFGKQVAQGNKLTVWGNLFIVNAIVLGKRVDIAMTWWQDRPKKPAQPRPVARPQGLPRSPNQAVRSDMVRPTGYAEPAPVDAPSMPDLGVGI